MVLNAFFIPFSISFEPNISQNENRIYHIFLELLPVWIFAIDIFITLNTAFYSKGTLIKKKSIIFMNYVKNHLTLDVISLGPFFIINSSSIVKKNNKLIEMLFLLRIIRMKNLMKKIRDSFLFPESFQNVFELFRLLFFVIYLAHICGCAWHFIALQEIKLGYQKTWIHHYNLIDESILIK